MHRQLSLVLLAGAVACHDAGAPLAPAAGEPSLAVQSSGERIPNEWLVQLNDDAGDVPGLARALARAHGGEVRSVWTHALKGFALRIPDAAAEGLARNPHVKHVSPNYRMTLAGTQTSAPWGLDRIDHRSLPLNSVYNYPYTGAGVRVYVIDSGIRTTHNDFGGRASHGWDFVDNDADATDCLGHGTHVAGIVGGSTYGVAKGVSLVAVRIGDCNGGTSGQLFLDGVNWVAGHAASNPGLAVANMSAGGPADAILDNAVRGAVSAGVSFVVSSGNANWPNTAQPACNYSPARVAEAITVGATDVNDDEAAFSYYGSCVDLLAPGVNVPGPASGSNTATRTDNGTSFSAPHVAGAAALYRQYNPSATPAQVQTAIVNGASVNKIDIASGHTNTPNKLLFTPFIGWAASMSGPTTIGHTNSCSWSVSAAGGIAPYTYGWSTYYSSPSTGFYITSGNGTSSISGWGYYYQSYPQYTTINLMVNVSDAAGQTLSLQRPVSLYGSPMGCY